MQHFRENTRTYLICITLGLLFNSISLFAQQKFQIHYLGSGNEQARSILQTMDGGYLIAGETTGFGAGQSDIFLIKIDSIGDTVWTKTYGGTGNEFLGMANIEYFGSPIIETQSGGFIIAGSSNSFGANYDSYLIKTNSMGDTIWTKTYASNSGNSDDDALMSINPTGLNEFILSGYTKNISANFDAHIIKVDSNGNSLLSVVYGHATDEMIARNAVATTDGGYLISGGGQTSGSFLIKTDAVGDTSWVKIKAPGLNLRGMAIEAADSTFIFLGKNSLQKLDPIGDSLVMKDYGPSFFLRSIIETADMGYVITGGTDSGEVILAKTDADLNSQWVNIYGAGSGFSVRQTADNGYIILADGNGIPYIIKTDQGGQSGQCVSSLASPVLGLTALDDTQVTISNTSATQFPAGASIDNVSVSLDHECTEWNVIGHITDNTVVTIDSGIVYLYKYISNTTPANLIDSSFIDANGNYQLQALDDIKYLISARPNRQLFPDLFPSYFGDTPFWSDATVLTFSKDTVNIDILISIKPSLTGTGRISGILIRGNYTGKTSGPGDPLNGDDVFLIASGDSSLVHSATTVETGFFSFTNLPENT
ncbi:MAG: WD40 repeat domain-containing protein, partial [Bacteroidetes bacterium]|nr:WD40 repeat domain-containing protein [Bacteroidota bacterium]